MAKQTLNTPSGRPVTSREDLARVQNQVVKEKAASAKQHDADLAKLDRLNSSQCDND